jgi:hypothetical protein
MLLIALCLAMLLAAPAYAGQAATGDALFYPCTTCHPVTGNPAALKLPNGFKGHEVPLVGHDALGVGKTACLTCHDDPSKNPGMLKTADGSLVAITGDVSLVCYRCHSAKYREFKAGTHGKRKPKCTAAGCHDPHTPRWIYASPLLPFVGTGFQAKVLSDREPFRALPIPQSRPAPQTPQWFSILAAFGIVVAGGLVGQLIRGRSNR